MKHALSSSEHEEKKPTDKRQKIMDAAVKVFAGKGFYNSTVADVAREADVADGTIYLYFKNKDDLLISIFEHSMDMFIRVAQETMSGIIDPTEKLSQFVKLHLKLVEKNPDLAQVIQIELRSSSRFMKEYANEKFFEYLDILQQIIEEGQKKGVFRNTADPVFLKRAVFGAIDEMALEWILMRKKRYPVETAAAQICDMFLKGIAT